MGGDTARSAFVGECGIWEVAASGVRGALPEASTSSERIATVRTSRSETISTSEPGLPTRCSRVGVDTISSFWRFGAG
jgi:hypothetical protein